MSSSAHRPLLLLFLLPFAFVSPLLLTVSPALANDPVAERLYLEGRAAAQARDWERACKLFQESQNREPAPGALLSLADCEEHRGKLVTAAAEFQVAARLFPPDDARVRYATERAAALEKRIAKLRIRLEGDGAASVECDGGLVDTASLGKYVAMDPGAHVFVVRAPGLADTRSTIHLAEGESRDLVLKLGPPDSNAARRTSEAAPDPVEAAAPQPTATPQRPAPPVAETSSPNRIPAYALLGAGAVGIGVGAVAGVLALDSASEIGSVCPAHRCPSEAEQRAADNFASRTRTMALVSTIGFGVGIASAVGGTYFLLRKPGSPAVAPAVGGGTAGVLVQGSF